MNITFSSILVFSAIAYSFSSSATECASVSVEDNEEFIYQLAANNYQSIDRKHRKSDKYDRFHNYYLEQGKHTLSFAKWRKKDYLSLKRGTQKAKDFKSPKPIVISIDVSNNNHYLLTSKKNTGELFIKDLKSRPCNVDQSDILLAKKVNSTINLVLPDSLQYRLDQLMIAGKGNHDKNLVPTRVVSYFGAFAQKEKNKEILTILAITPYSPAFKLGLRAGDKISSMGEAPVSSWETENLEPLSAYIHQLKAGQLLSFSLLRSGEKMNISGTFEPTIIPQFEYQFDNQAPSTLVNAIDEESNVFSGLSKIILEINSLPEIENRADVDLLVIERNKAYDLKYGISGTMLVQNKAYGFKVDHVKPNSSAALMGLQVGDTLTKINKVEFREDDVHFISSQISQLINGQKYTIEVMRNNAPTLLVGDYTKIEIPAYRLIIDNKSKLMVEELLTNYNKALKQGFRMKDRLEYERNRLINERSLNREQGLYERPPKQPIKADKNK